MPLHLRLHPVTAMAPHFLLRRDLVIAQLVVPLAMAKADSVAGFARSVRAMEFRPAVAAVSFGIRFSPAPDLSAAVLSAVCRCPRRFPTPGFFPPPAPFDPSRP